MVEDLILFVVIWLSKSLFFSRASCFSFFGSSNVVADGSRRFFRIFLIFVMVLLDYLVMLIICVMVFLLLMVDYGVCNVCCVAFRVFSSRFNLEYKLEMNMCGVF